MRTPSSTHTIPPTPTLPYTAYYGAYMSSSLGYPLNPNLLSKRCARPGVFMHL